MPKLRSSKSAPAGIKDASQAVKKRSSLRAMFSFWKFSKKTPVLAEAEIANPIISGPASKDLGFSTASLPTGPTRERSDSEGSSSSVNSEPALPTIRTPSTASLPAEVRPPFARHVPSPSNSSASSLEFTSDASTAATSPSNSSPSILIKSLSSASIVTMGGSAAAIVDTPVEPISPPKQASPNTTKLPKPVKRSTDSYQKHPSPLSSVMDAHSPYTMPSAPPRSMTSQSHENHQPRRRSSLGNFLRRSQSHPDLADLTQEYLPPLPPMPKSNPSSSRPRSSSSLARAKSFRRRSDGRKPDGVGGYTEDQKIERMSILGADPAGYGYYLYPTSKPEVSNGKNSSASGLGKRTRPAYLEDWKRHSWGSNSDNGRVSTTAAPSSKAWKDARGRSFRRTVTQAIPEEAGDSLDPDKRAQSPDSGCDSLDMPPTGKGKEIEHADAILRV
ncbi:hypothetical protein DFP73DRAFT_125075 [Morchella snyderi]|nr:hypothetical protein DFP73DRAFT_125075 [Morchella snyderi]